MLRQVSKTSAIDASVETSVVPRTGYVREIDALRAFAVIAVVLQHCFLFPPGWAGVWLFYVVSGFAITTSLLSSPAPEGSEWRAMGNFMARRAVRIWPVYFIYVLANAVLILASGDYLALINIPLLLTFTFNFNYLLVDQLPPGSEWPLIEHLWTISVEEQFYLFYPLLFLFLPRKHLQPALWSLLIISPLLRLGWSYVGENASWGELYKSFAVYTFSPGHFDAFAMGALLALNRQRLAASRKLAWSVFGYAVAFAAAYVAVFGWINVWIFDEISVGAFTDNLVSTMAWGEGRQVFIYSVVAGLSGGVVALILAGVPAALWLCSSLTLQWMGRISYGIYVYHAVPLLLAEFIVPGEGHPISRQIVVFGLCFPLTVLMAYGSYLYIERPFLKLRKRFA